MNKEWNILLNKSLDGTISATESKKLREALESHPELREEARELTGLSELMNRQDYTFGPFFTEKVMNRIDILLESGLSKNLMVAFQRIALPGLVAAIIIFLFAVLSGSLSLDSLMGVDSLQPQYLSDFLIFNF